ncbi:MAG: carboxypeptidase regulatory-like domain-containing protein [Acidobacteria bacterium]|nr:carboxypeptidase regulatory-like domain-containing protein [Acidobacteriota bacterium]
MNAHRNPSYRLRRGFLLYFLSLLCILYFLPSPAFSQRSGRATIDGVVTESDGTPVSGAQVVIQTSDGKKPRAVKTDTKGRFEFRSLRHGFYDIRASHEGRSSEWVRNLVLRSGTVVSVTLVLPEKSGAP